MKFGVWEKDGVITLLAEPEEDGVRYFIRQEVKEGFLDEIPYHVLKKYAPGMVDIDPDTFQIKRVEMDS